MLACGARRCCFPRPRCPTRRRWRWRIRRRSRRLRLGQRARSGRIDGLGSVDVGDHVGRLDRTAGSGGRRMFDMAQCEDARCDIAHVGHCIADAQCDGGHDGNRHRDRSASSRIAVIASVIHSQTTPSLRHLFTIRTVWIATKHLMTVHTAAGKPQPLCSIGFHSDLANTAWNEIGT